jgi:Uma2 family endonuclease
MVMLIAEPHLEEELIAERRASGADRFDEVWEGVYHVSPIPNIEHQELAGILFAIFLEVVRAGKLGMAYPGVNVSDREEDWTQNYRGPDVAVVLAGCHAKNCGTHWFGGPDLVVEVVSPHDRSRDKIDFYSLVGVREFLIVDRFPWALELYRLNAGRLQLAGRSTSDAPSELQSSVLPLNFRLVPGDARPVIEVTHHDGSQTWRI